MACVLRVSGRRFDVDAYLAGRNPLPATAVFRRGEPKFKVSQPHGKRNQRSGCNIVVSNKEFGNLSGQMRDAVRFLAKRGPAVRALIRKPGVESAILDFGVARRPEAVVQVDVLPEELVRLAGMLGLALALSLYPAADE